MLVRGSEVAQASYAIKATSTDCDDPGSIAPEVLTGPPAKPDKPIPADDRADDGATVPSLTERRLRLARLPSGTRPSPPAASRCPTWDSWPRCC
ncbi:hypothetical protein GCM10009678_44440 [Actinomadura kijaniata]